MDFQSVLPKKFVETKHEPRINGSYSKLSRIEPPANWFFYRYHLIGSSLPRLTSASLCVLSV